MTVFTEGRATAEFMISEARGFRSQRVKTYREIEKREGARCAAGAAKSRVRIIVVDGNGGAGHNRAGRIVNGS